MLFLLFRPATSFKVVQPWSMLTENSCLILRLHHRARASAGPSRQDSVLTASRRIKNRCRIAGDSLNRACMARFSRKAGRTVRLIRVGDTGFIDLGWD